MLQRLEHDAPPIALDNLKFFSTLDCDGNQAGLEGMAPTHTQDGVVAVAAVVVTRKHQRQMRIDVQIEFAAVFVAGGQIDWIARTRCRAGRGHHAGFTSKVTDRPGRTGGRPACCTAGALCTNRCMHWQCDADAQQRVKKPLWPHD